MLGALAAEIKAYHEKQQIELPTYADPVALTRGQIMMILPDNAISYPCTLVVDQKESSAAHARLRTGQHGTSQSASDIIS